MGPGKDSAPQSTIITLPSIAFVAHQNGREKFSLIFSSVLLSVGWLMTGRLSFAPTQPGSKRQARKARQAGCTDLAVPTIATPPMTRFIPRFTAPVFTAVSGPRYPLRYARFPP